MSSRHSHLLDIVVYYWNDAPLVHAGIACLILSSVRYIKMILWQLKAIPINMESDMLRMNPAS